MVSMRLYKWLLLKIDFQFTEQKLCKKKLDLVDKCHKMYCEKSTKVDKS